MLIQPDDNDNIKNNILSLLTKARTDPKIAAAMMADLPGYIEKEHPEIDISDDMVQELSLRLYHAQAIVNRTLDTFYDELNQDLSDILEDPNTTPDMYGTTKIQ